LCSETSAITRDSGNVTAVAHSVGCHETSAVMLLQAASNVRTGSNKVVETMNIDQNNQASAITRDSGNVTAVAHSVGGHETSAVMLLQATSNVMNSASATAVALSSGGTGSNKVVETTNMDENNQVGIQKLLELAGRAEEQRSMESSSTNSISTSKASTNTGATITAPNTTTSVAAPRPTLPMNASNCSSNEKSTTVPVATTESESSNKEDTSTSLSTNNYNYKVCYNVELQNTIDGYMLFLGGNSHNTPYAFDYKVCFESYKRHKGDVLSHAEKKMVMRNKHDVVLAVNDQDVSGLVLEEVLDIIKTYKTNPETCEKKLKLTFLDRVSFNAFRSVKSVFKG
jgi:hypothetical protein